MKGQDGKILSESLAALIVDALVDAKIIKEEDFEKAVAIATEEIDARKAAGDY
jgi:hypothetical protein